MAEGNGGGFDILKVMKALTDAIHDLAGKSDRQRARTKALEQNLVELRKRVEALEEKVTDDEA